MEGQYLKVGHYHFPPHISRLIINNHPAKEFNMQLLFILLLPGQASEPWEPSNKATLLPPRTKLSLTIAALHLLYSPTTISLSLSLSLSESLKY
jgi:hypothetical protein